MTAWTEATALGDALLRRAATAPDDDALVFPDERLSYGQLAGRARELARGLIGLGLEPGDPVGLLMANSPQFVTTFYGVTLAGGLVVPINTRYRAVEIPHVVNNAGLRFIVTDNRIDDYVDLLALLQDAVPGLSDAPDPADLALEAAPRLGAVVVLGDREHPGTLNESDLSDRARDVPDELLEHRRSGVFLRRPAVILYTSGTTSLPRGCLLSHEALYRNWVEVGRVLRVGPEDVFWAPCPLFHLAAIGPLVLCVATGATFVSDVYFEPARALELVARERATVLYPAYPPITQALLDAPGFQQADLSAARAMLNVAPPDTLRQMQAALPHVTQVSLYGLTEAGGAATYGRLDEDLEVRLNTCGGPLPGVDVVVADPETREPLPAGATGEILVRGYSLFDGYHEDPELTANAFTADGFFCTGDHGVLDADGRLSFLGRLKEMLKVGGENVAPAEIEAHLSTHPAVKLVQVVGIPDARLDEVPVAFVELKAGASASEDELQDWCKGDLARFKVPRHVRFVTDWPMSATKIQKQPLRDQIIAELKQAPARLD